MQLQMRVVALQGFHLDETSLLQVVESQLLALELLHVLHDLSEYVDNVDQVVPLIIDRVNQLAGLSELAHETQLDHVRHQVRMRRVTHLEHILLRHNIKPRICRLQVVQRIPHVSLRREYQRLQSPLVVLNILLVHDDLQPLQHLLISQLGKPHNGAPRLNRLNDLG